MNWGPRRVHTVKDAQIKGVWEYSGNQPNGERAEGQ